MTPVVPSAGRVLAPLESIPDHGALVVDIDRVSLLLTRRGSDVTAFLNRCPHAGYQLQRADGRVLVQELRYIVCAAHGASFELAQGLCAGGPCNGEALIPVAVALVGSDVVTA